MSGGGGVGVLGGGVGDLGAGEAETGGGSCLTGGSAGGGGVGLGGEGGGVFSANSGPGALGAFGAGWGGWEGLMMLSRDPLENSPLPGGKGSPQRGHTSLWSKSSLPQFVHFNSPSPLSFIV